MDVVRRHLWEPGTARFSESLLREAALALAEFAVNRELGDEVFDSITEGRAKWAGYSGCGDLAHWMMYMLGVRDERIVNRDTDGGRHPWRIGKNLSMLVYNTRAVGAWSTSWPPRDGDIVYVTAPEHVFVYGGSADPALSRLRTIVTYNYGQVTEDGRPCGRLKLVDVSIQGGAVLLGRRTYLGHVDISRLPYAESATLPETFQGGVIDDNPYYNMEAEEV